MVKQALVSFCSVFSAIYAGDAFAAGCETNFVRQGSFPDRHQYFSHVNIEGLTATQAFAQIRNIFADMGMRILSEDRSAALMTAELPATMFTQAQPITVRYGSANGLATVQMVQAVNAGVIMTNGIMRRQICTALSRLTAPVAATALPQLPRIQSIAATELARQVQSARDNPARVKQAFGGKQFRVTGTVNAVSETHNAYAVQFEGIHVPAIRLGERDSTTLRVVCYIPKTRVKAAAALYPNAKGTLTGTFYRLENHSLMPEIALDDCGA